ncbi:MAG: hypothetical protein HC930_05190 [Hydrococcus sp. SU_1_0]|nr:hypothetical protein [Hydrococcus sp. SU_1_0]
MTRITEFATEPQKPPSTSRIYSVALQTTYELIALLGESGSRIFRWWLEVDVS